MPAIAVAQYRVRPSKASRFIELNKQVKQLAAKHGLGRRLLMSLLAGESVGTYSGIFDAADLATLATGLQTLYADPAWAPIQEALAADDVCTLVSYSQANEIPL